ncbi:nuclear transport factor 2 family protein [Algoriphagus sp. A40]|uniref:nuclear transport factor 2 family protein n=1 Tax=Algoriphagus sp. A40 TaxID=1945863 RepID=UPI001438A08A|nr:nuclear transport factor 2 family protein [Algoriphagus sp. A40]
MKTRLILSIAAFAVFSSTAFAQSQDEILLKKLIEGAFEDVLTQFKAEKIPDYFTEHFMLIENGEIWNNDSTRNYVERAKSRTPQAKRENRFDYFSIEVKGDVALVSYHNYATFTTENSPPRKIHWLETVVAVKTDAGWRIRLLHNSSGKE